jgi:hypothetical protein
MYYIGLDVHKRKISYCVKDGSGKVYAEGSLPATRFDLDHWMKTLPQPWTAAMEATMFTGWIYDHLKPHAAANAGKGRIEMPNHCLGAGMQHSPQSILARQSHPDFRADC